MKIVAGISDMDEADYLVRNGADEIYFGLSFIHNHKDEKSLRSEAEMRCLLKLCASFRKPLYLAMNEIYQEKDYKKITETAKRFAAGGGDGLMLRDPGLMHFLRKKGFKKHLALSTLGHCFNAEAMKLYYSLGISRIVLPQHLLPSEAGHIIKNALGIETEVFYLPDGFCRNVDGACRFHDLPLTDSALATGSGYNCELVLRTGKGPFSLPKVTYDDAMTRISEFRDMGVEYFKLPRDYDFEWTKRCLVKMLDFKAQRRPAKAPRKQDR